MNTNFTDKYFTNHGWHKLEDKDEYGKIIEYYKTNGKQRLIILVEIPIREITRTYKNYKIQFCNEQPYGLRDYSKITIKDFSDIRAICRIFDLK